jgi:hypothetical protein
MIGAKRTLVSAFVALVLVGTALTSVWLLASAGVFSGAEQPLPGAPETSETSVVEDTVAGTLAISSGFQASQPRDPFDPLIDVPGPDSSSTTIDDDSSTTTSADGSTTTTDPSGTTPTSSGTTTTVGDSPDGIRVALLEVRQQNGVLVAVVEVDGDTSTVGVGDTFADDFKVVSLTSNGGVFTYGDSAFTLAVGQSIYK